MELEAWAAIAEAPAYEVSSWGRVRRGPFEVASWPNKKGYHLVSIELPGRAQPALRYVHRLVLRAFRGAPAPGLLANHDDGRKGHNELRNLAWATRSANVQHAYALGLIPRRRARLERRGQVRLPFEATPTDLSDRTAPHT